MDICIAGHVLYQNYIDHGQYIHVAATLSTLLVFNHVTPTMNYMCNSTTCSQATVQFVVLAAIQVLSKVLILCNMLV